MLPPELEIPNWYIDSASAFTEITQPFELGPNELYVAALNS